MNGLRKTLENVRDIVKGIPNVQDVFIGDIYDNLNANQSVCYPAGVISKGDMRMDFQNKRIYTTLNIFLCDRETDDKSNKLQVQSWATSALYQITKSLNKSKFYIPQETVQVKTFEERFGSVAAGAFLTCEVFTPMSECETLDWGTPAPPPESSIKGLQFKAILDDMDVYFRQIGSFTYYPPFVYTFDGLEWTDWDYRNDEPIHVKEGQSVWIKSKTAYNRAISGWSTSYRYFDFVGNGLVMGYQYIDYLHGENFIDTIYTGDYAQLFKNATKLVKAPDIYSTIKNDAVNLYYQCQDMFSGCTGLIYGPKELKCDMPKSYMWTRMFNGCVALLKTPHIVIGNQTPNNDSSGNYMCSRMFDGCTGLREIDMEIKYEDVSATGQYEFSYMFRNCTNLTDASNFNFPMKTLNIHMLRQCFDGCTSLVKAPEILCTELRQASAITTAACNLLSMFNNCTSLEDGPTQILSEVIPYQGCQNMFYGCTKLKNAPYLNAKTIHQNGCTSMFYNCDALTNDNVQDVFDFNYIGTSGCQQMFQSCGGLTKAPEINVLELGGTGALYQTFYQCTGITDCQDILNPMTLTTNCYYQMYDGCTNLTKAPVLPATTSVSGCYAYMFRNTKVNRIKCLLNPAASQTNWVSGISGTIRDGLFIKHPNATWPAAGVSSIPVNWTVINDGDDIIVNLDQTATEFTTKYDGLQVDQVNINYPLSTIGRWMGLCLPFDLNNNELKDIFGDNYELVEYRTGDTNFDFNDDDGTPHITLPNSNDVTELVAGKPYMVKPSKVVSSITATDKVIKSTIYTTIIEKDNWVMKLSGDFVKKDIPKSDAATHTWYFALNGGQWQYTGQIVPLNGYRVSFIISPKDTTNAAPPRMLMKSASPKASNPLDDLDTTLLTFLTEHGLENEYIKYITEQ